MSRSLDQWLSYLETRTAKTIQLGLDRIHKVAETLEVLNFKTPIITVGGTNGKGSTVAALAAVYMAAGYKVATYTSPHLRCFEERISINGFNIKATDLCELFNIIENAKGDTELTFFEFATLAALLYFKEKNPDLIILEVGMGGRLDAVNIIDATVSIVTTVAFDHEEYLGNTLEKIGYEKAGIFRSKRPCIYADLNPPSTLITYAKNIGANLYCYNLDYFDTKIEAKYLYPQVTAAVQQNVKLLEKKLPVSLEALKIGLQMPRISGRLEIVKDSCTLLLDVAHNEQSVLRLREFILNNFQGKKIHAVFSALADKNIKALVSPLVAVVSKWWVSVLPNSSRTATKEQLLDVFESEGCVLTEVYTEPYLALTKAKSKVSKEDVIVIYGSFFTVANVMDNNWRSV